MIVARIRGAARRGARRNRRGVEILLELFAFGDAGWGDEMLAGLMVTIELAVVSLPVGLLLGFLAAGATLSSQGWLRAIGTGYTTVMRGLPELLTLFVVYNGLAGC